jgi:hypothetical protein
MRRRLAWLAGALGVAALLRALRRRQAAAVPEAPPERPDPADELRSALAETRESEAAPAAEEPPSLEQRRRRVHEQAQEAIDAMREPEP